MKRLGQVGASLCCKSAAVSVFVVAGGVPVRRLSNGCKKCIGPRPNPRLVCLRPSPALAPFLALTHATRTCPAPQYKNTKTCGIIEVDHAGGVTKVAEPVGVVAGGRGSTTVVEQ